MNTDLIKRLGLAAYYPKSVEMKTKDDLMSECNRYANGICTTRACLVRGGWKPGEPVNYEISVCDAHEIISLRDKCRELEEHIAELEGVIEGFNQEPPTYNNERI